MWLRLNVSGLSIVEFAQFGRFICGLWRRSWLFHPYHKLQAFYFTETQPHGGSRQLVTVSWRQLFWYCSYSHCPHVTKIQKRLRRVSHILPPSGHEDKLHTEILSIFLIKIFWQKYLFHDWRCCKLCRMVKNHPERCRGMYFLILAQ